MNPVLSQREFLLMQKMIEVQCGISLGEDKSYLIESRLSKLMAELSISSFEELYLVVSSGDSPEINEKVIDAITTNETFWFRDRTPWDVLEDILLPAYIQELNKGQKSKVRVWSATCSTGQEPYSVAMCIDNYLSTRGIKDIGLDNFEILATDISCTALETARSGSYDGMSVARGLEDKYRDRYFIKLNNTWYLDDKIKNAVDFRHFNLQDSFILLGKFDVVFCRNVFIYFSDRLKKELIRKIAAALNPQGVMFVGSSELLPCFEENFIMDTYNSAVFYRLKK